MKTYVNQVPESCTDVCTCFKTYNYDTRVYSYHVSCTCGYSGDFTDGTLPIKYCAHCGSPLICSDYGDSWGHENSFKCVFIDLRTPSTHHIIYNKRTFLVNETESGSVKKTSNVFVVDYNFLENRLDIYEDGKLCEKITQSLQKSAFSYITEDLISPNHLLACVCNYATTTSVYKAIQLLTKIPSIEILYNTYGNLERFKGLDKSYIIPRATTPHHALGLPRNVHKAFLTCNRSINKYFNLILELHNHFKEKPDITSNIITNYIKNLPGDSVPLYIELVIKQNYDAKHLFNYCTDLVYTYQGITSPRECLQLLTDYITMCVETNVPYERFPKSLKLVHDMARKNYRLFTTEETRRKFMEFVSSSDYMNLELIDSNSQSYVVVAPKCIEDLINEGRSLSHCVDSYVNYVAERNRKILFMRYSESPEKSLITLDIRNNHIVQYAGFSNRSLTEPEMEYLKYYANKKELVII